MLKGIFSTEPVIGIVDMALILLYSLNNEIYKKF